MTQDFLTVDYPKVINIDHITEVDDLKRPLLFPTICVVERGFLTLATPEEDYFLSQGDVFVVATNSPLVPQSQTPFSLQRLSFYENTHYFESFFLADKPLTKLNHQEEQVMDYFHAIEECYITYLNDPQLKIKLVLDAHLMTLISTLLPVQILQKKENYIDKDLQKAIDFFSDNYAQPIKINEVAMMIGLHPNYFTKKFKEYYGLSPKAFLTSIRIKKASVLMRSTDLTLKEIARIVGYHDYLTFRKAFKKYYQNSSPTSFLNE